MNRCCLILFVCVAGAAAMPGCQLGALIGGMAESYRETSTRTVEAQYDDFVNKSFAVLVAVDRGVQGNHPNIVPRFLSRFNDRLLGEANLGASGVVPAAAMLDYQLSNPDWPAKSYGQIADELGVDRLIVVDIYEYRLQEPGNSYLWDGVAAARVGVVEADGFFPGDYAFSQEVRVGFPDVEGLGPIDLSEDLVSAALEKRLTDRVTWLFYEHEEPYYPDY